MADPRRSRNPTTTELPSEIIFFNILPLLRPVKSLLRSTTELPSEIIFFNILPLLPVKSLLRFKCVCKQWHSFLTTPMFAEIHLRHVTNNNDHQSHKLVVLSKTSPCMFSTIDCETPEHGCTAGRPLPFKANCENMKIISSLNGLLCVGITKSRYANKYSDIILWNPSTNVYKTLSKANSQKECFEVTGKAFGLYYTSFDDDYKLLRVAHNRNSYAYIYSLKSDSWRTIKAPKIAGYQTSKHWKTSTMNEKVYFLKTKYLFHGSLGHGADFIIVFDTKTEKFRRLAGPSFGSRVLSFMVVRGCIHLCVDVLREEGGRAYVKWWKMDGNGDWRECNYPALPVFCCQDTLHLMKKAGYYLSHSRSKVYVNKLDPPVTRGVKYAVDDNMDILPRGKFIETFVSPNRYT